MSEQEQSSLTVSTVFYPPDSSEAAIRQVGFGLQPLILIEPIEDEETGDVNFKITGSLIDQAETADILDLLVYALRNGEAQDEESKS